MRGHGLELGAPTLTGETAPSAITKLASTSPTPTNAIAVALLDAIPQFATADEAIASGVPESARAFLPPHGMFPWMRLIAFGLDDGVFKAPDDTAWWSAPYPLVELYPAVGSWVDIMAASGHTNFSWDQQLAEGDSSAIAQSLMVSAKELEDVVEQEGCPKFIPNKVRGFPPTPNPACWKPELDKLKDVVDKLHGGKKSQTSGQTAFLLLLAFGYLVIKGKL